MTSLQPLRVALAQINTTVGDIDGNAAKIVDSLGAAREAGRAARRVPGAGDQRLSARGPAAEDAFPGGRRARRSTEIARRASTDMVALVGFAEHAEDVYNSSRSLADGEVQGIYRKMFLPNYGVFDEQRYFQAGDAPGRRCASNGATHRPHGLRGHLGARARRPATRRSRGRGDRQRLRLAVPPGQGHPARADARPARPRQPRLRRLLQPRRRPGRARLRRLQPRRRPGRRARRARRRSSTEELIVCDIDPSTAQRARLRDARHRPAARAAPAEVADARRARGAARVTARREVGGPRAKPLEPDAEVYAALRARAARLRRQERLRARPARASPAASTPRSPPASRSTRSAPSASPAP